VIRIHITEDSYDKEGGWHCYVTGHAEHPACAAVTSIWRAMTLGFEWIAKQRPDDIHLNTCYTRVAKPKPKSRKRR
jgi:hypothetical protein